MVLNLSYVPIVNPEIVTGVATMLLFVVLNGTISDVLTALLGNEVRVSFGIGTLLIAHVTFCLPYVLFNAQPQACARWMCACTRPRWTLAGNPRQAFFKVVLPEIMPAIISAFLISLTYSIDDFIISYFSRHGANAAHRHLFHDEKARQPRSGCPFHHYVCGDSHHHSGCETGWRLRATSARPAPPEGEARV